MLMSQPLHSFRCSSCDWRKFVSLTQANLPSESVNIIYCPQCQDQRLSIITGRTLADMFLQLSKATPLI